MRVFLCQSYMGPDSSAPPLVFPIGLAYLASMIKDDHAVYCWNPNVTQNPVKELPRLLEKTRSKRRHSLSNILFCRIVFLTWKTSFMSCFKNLVQFLILSPENAGYMFFEVSPIPTRVNLFG